MYVQRYKVVSNSFGFFGEKKNSKQKQRFKISMQPDEFLGAEKWLKEMMNETIISRSNRTTQAIQHHYVSAIKLTKNHRVCLCMCCCGASCIEKWLTDAFIVIIIQKYLSLPFLISFSYSAIAAVLKMPSTIISSIKCSQVRDEKQHIVENWVNFTDDTNWQQTN